MLLKIDGSLNRINFSAAHFIPTIEKCSRLHGHDYSVSVELEGEEKDGILIDYGIVKKAVRALADSLDHKVLLPESSPLTRVSCDHKVCTATFGAKEFRFPVSDVYILERPITSSEMIADYMGTKLAQALKPNRNLTRLQICVYEGPGQCTCKELKLTYE